MDKSRLVRNSALLAPQSSWWSPLGKDEKLWALICVVWALSMFAMMQLIWPRIGNEHTNIQTYRTDPLVYRDHVEAFTTANEVGERAGKPVVEPPPGDVHVLAQRYEFWPILRLKRGETYTLHLSSLDVQHGFSLLPDNVNFQVLPGYVTQIDITPEQAGDYVLVCNEYCGTGHHLMAGAIEVIE